MDDRWSLYNSKTQDRRDYQTLDDIRELLQSLHRDEQRFWFAWSEGMPNWTAALDVLSERGNHSLTHKNREPITDLQFIEIEYGPEEVTQIPTVDLSEPENQVIAIERAQPSSQATAAYPDISTGAPEKTGFDRRRYPRFHARFRVMIKSENLTFRTFSMDVSLGGLAIETAVPPGFVGATCQVQIGNQTSGETVHFTAKLLTARSESKYFSFVRSPQDSLNRLQRWLAACEPMKRAG